MGMEIPQGDINTNLITYTITSILTHTQHHKWKKVATGREYLDNARSGHQCQQSSQLRFDLSFRLS